MPTHPFSAMAELTTASGRFSYARLTALSDQGIVDLSTLPYCIKVLLESALRNVDGHEVTSDDVLALAKWHAADPAPCEIPFKPARVVLQDFTGVPSVVDLAALRSAMARMGGDPSKVNPLVPVDLVIDHSVQVDRFGSEDALAFNAKREFERNGERYAFLRWGQKAFSDFSVVPPATGIVHQVNLEYLAKVVQRRPWREGGEILVPDSLVGTDSHTTMINGLGVVGWGVGGIEAEAVMLGQPIYMLLPKVVGFELTGALPEGATATDLVLTVTQQLRSHGVVGKFVEFFGDGVDQLSLPDRATIANMAPEYGATMGYFPVDAETIRFLKISGRDDELCELVETYFRAQTMFRTAQAPTPTYTEVLRFDMANVVPSLAGPKRPQDRIALADMKPAFRSMLVDTFNKPVGERPTVAVELDGRPADLTHGSVVIAAITSCTNTSNPSVMLAAGILAKKAVERGLAVSPAVKTSLAPGSKVVTRYLEEADLLRYLEQLRFHVVGYGCTTCIGNSGPLAEPVAAAARDHGLVLAAVLSGNRNFEGRVNPHTQANFLASPPLVVAYALAGTVDFDFKHDALGTDRDGKPVYLREIWPSHKEVRTAWDLALSPKMFTEEYSQVQTGNATWNAIKAPEGQLYPWDKASTYVQEPPFFVGMTSELPPKQLIQNARVLAVLPDSTTTDHISPAGAIEPSGPAARYLLEHGVERADWNSYGSRRGNHEVMMRGTFANIRIRNGLVPGIVGGFTRHLPSGQQLSIYDAAMRYREEGTPSIVLAGKEYGTGSSRDWAAKGPQLLGVVAVIAESYERIHRSNLVGMGILPLEYSEGESAKSLGLTGEELFSVEGLDTDLTARQELTVRAADPETGVETRFVVRVRIDTPVEVEYYANGGILHTVLRRMHAHS